MDLDDKHPPEAAPEAATPDTTTEEDEEGAFRKVYQQQQDHGSFRSNDDGDRVIFEPKNPAEQQEPDHFESQTSPVAAAVNNDPLLGHLPPSSSNPKDTTLEDIDADVLMNSPLQLLHGDDDDDDYLEEGDPARQKFQNEYNVEEDYEDHDYCDDYGEEAFEDPYADSPFPDQEPSTSPYHSNNSHRHSTKYYNDDIPADAVGTSTRMNAVDPFGELEYSRNGMTREDEMEEIEMSHNDELNLKGGDYTAEYELESKDTKTQGWQACLQRHGKALGLFASGLCFSGTLVAIILVATINSQEKNPWSNETPHYEGTDGSHSLSPWGPRKDSVPTGPFVPPPLELETICTEEAVSASQEGFNACAKLCEPAECCRFDALAAPHLSCQRGHTQDCHTYHHYCSKPPKGAIITFQAPSGSIADTCTPENMHTAAGVTACARECMGGTCCRYPTTLAGLSCLRGHEQECQVYHTYCESKEKECDTDHTFCQPTSNSQNNTATTTGTSTGTSTSGEGNQQPADPTGLVSFPFVKPPTSINVTCATTAVANPEGFEGCLDVCGGGTCCRFDPDREPSLSCRKEQPGDCRIYDQYCGGNTHTVSTEAPVNPAYGTGISGNSNDNNNANEIPETYVESVCSDTSLATVEGYGNCETACGKAECCWNTDVGACPTGAHCAPFAHCLALKNSEYEDIAIRVHIDARCTDEKVATQAGNYECKTACSQAACCFDSSEQCPQKSDSFCELYAACSKVMDEIAVPPAPSSLQVHCAASNLGTIEGLANCDRTCSHAPCCWNSNVESCVTKNPLCEDYEPCLVLTRDFLDSEFTPTEAPVPAVPTIPTAPNFLKDVCTEQKIANIEGATLCHDACKAGECCWKDITCAEQSQCEGYNDCAVLIESEHLDADAPTITQIPDYLSTSCDAEMHSKDEVHGHLCADACKRAECCWSSESDTVCKSDPHCAGYDICATKDLDQITTTVAPQSDTSMGGEEQQATDTSGVGDPKYTEEMITDVCMNHDNSIVNLCAKVCVGSECCFEDPSGCEDGLCEKYAACSELHPTDSAVEAACSSEDRSDCVAACGGSTCCFTTDIEKSCANTNPGIVCSQFKPCEKLYGFGG